MSQNILI